MNMDKGNPHQKRKIPVSPKRVWRCQILLTAEVSYKKGLSKLWMGSPQILKYADDFKLYPSSFPDLTQTSRLGEIHISRFLFPGSTHQGFLLKHSHMPQPRRGFRSTQMSRPFTGRLAGGVVEKRGGGRGDACVCVCVRARVGAGTC